MHSRIKLKREVGFEGKVKDEDYSRAIIEGIGRKNR